MRTSWALAWKPSAEIPIDEVLALVEPLVPRDNPTNLLAFSTLYLRVSELLAGLGVIDEAGPTPFTIVGPDGVRREVTIEPVSPAVSAAWDFGLPRRLAATDAPWLTRPGRDAVVDVPRGLRDAVRAVQRGAGRRDRRHLRRSASARRQTMSSAW